MPTSSPSGPTPGRWRRPTGGARRTGPPTCQRLLDATVELLTTTSWRSVKVTDIARQARTSPATFYQYFGNVEQAIRVLAEGMVDQAAQLAELVGGDWSEGASWDTALRGHRGLPLLLGGQPRRVPRRRPGHRGGRRAAAGHPGAGAQRGDRRPGAGDHRRLALAEGGPAGGRRARPPARTHGGGRDAGRHVRQRVGPPLRVRVLGHPHPSPRRHPGPHAALGRHRAPGAAGRGPAAEATRPRTGPVLGGATAANAPRRPPPT